ncbi:DegT/DnrJ/EryC1/StrS family aminotransferase [Candidatus Microgenomates bacterium]|nr:DegT/DnrJ/EryC1/StrS family aminotransferase [Candidatus Microgenomates bacterium]
MIKLIKSTFYQEEKTKQKLVHFIKNARQLSFGKECENFEIKFARWQGRKHCVMVNSGSSANLALFQALLNIGYLKKNDLVGFSAVTWSTNAMPIVQLGLQPVPVDIELNTINVSSKQLLKVLKKYPLKMLFITNLLGFCDDLEEIVKICREKKIILTEDNCESLGSVYRGKKLGNFGLASTFSFYVGHHMSTIEGGAICTDDEDLAIMLRLVRAHGWDRNLNFTKQKELRKKFHINQSFYARYSFYDLGFNFRPTEIAGFLGNVGLNHLPEIIKKRERNFMKLAKVLYTKSDRYYPLKYQHLTVNSNFAFPLICTSEKLRNELVKKCANKVEIRPIVGGNIRLQPFFTKYLTGDRFPPTDNADLVHRQGLYFGNNPELTRQEIELIINLFNS